MGGIFHQGVGEQPGVGDCAAGITVVKSTAPSQSARWRSCLKLRSCKRQPYTPQWRH